MNCYVVQILGPSLSTGAKATLMELKLIIQRIYSLSPVMYLVFFSHFLAKLSYLSHMTMSLVSSLCLLVHFAVFLGAGLYFLYSALLDIYFVFYSFVLFIGEKLISRDFHQTLLF